MAEPSLSSTDRHAAIEQRQQRLLADLDELNERIESVLDSLSGEADPDA